MLDIYLVRNPAAWDGRIREGERATHDRLDYDEWEALFFIVLMGYCPFVPYVEGMGVDVHSEQWRINFEQAIPAYPLLGRMWDQYVDATYQSEEIAHLRGECLKVQCMTDHVDALRGLGKLIRYCEEAENCGLGLFLACD